MATGTDSAEISSLLERLLRNRDGLSLFFPFIVGFADRETQQNPDQESPESNSQGERIIMINPFTRSMMVIGGSLDLDSLFRGVENGKGGPAPASKSAIDSMPRVEIRGHGEEDDCVICLDEMKAREVAAEMPCKHRFHGKCIEQWLGIHGTCPVCRYEMPVDDEDEEGKKRGEGRREIWVSFSIGTDRRRSEEGGR